MNDNHLYKQKIVYNQFDIIPLLSSIWKIISLIYFVCVYMNILSTNNSIVLLFLLINLTIYFSFIKAYRSIYNMKSSKCNCNECIHIHDMEFSYISSSLTFIFMIIISYKYGFDILFKQLISIDDIIFYRISKFINMNIIIILSNTYIMYIFRNIIRIWHN